MPARRPAPGGPGRLRGRLREYALSFPEAHEDHPWGESVVKVRAKVFLFLGSDDDPAHPPGFGVKLVASLEEALALPGVTPMGYGLGRAGWVTVRLDTPGLPPEDVLRDWVEESYRAVAPKRLAALLDTAGTA